MWWLVLLEATLFFSVICWEVAASPAAPVNHPVRFGVTVAGAAGLAMVLFHVLPAWLGQRMERMPWWFAVWLAVGYAERFSGATQAAGLLGLMGRLALLFLGLVALAVWRRELARVAGIVGLGLGLGLLLWAVATTWPGIWARNPHYGSEDVPAQFEESIAWGILRTSAAAFWIGWRVGRSGVGWRGILASGVLGVWVPAVVSVTMAAVAIQAGSTLHWRPTLFRGFTWGFLGREGMSLEWSLGWVCWTVLGTAVVSGLALRDMAPGWTGWRRLAFVPMGVAVLVAGMALHLWRPSEEGMYSLLAPPGLEAWVAGVLALSAVAVSRCARRGSGHTPNKETDSRS
ncbi:MAG: hypothetical protein JNK87_42905 [Bryobacterales bacterium]|nr:hypothetical protein [Bryobacterales bacterium]